MNKKKLAVCVLAFNRVIYLKKTIESVFKSYSKDFHLYVLDDNSQDNTDNYLKDLKNNFDFSVIKHPNNIGMGANANWILDNIFSKYVLMLHDDDLLEPRYISRVLEIIEKDDDIAIAGTSFNTIDEEDIILERFQYKKISSDIILNYKDYYFHHLEGLAFPWSGTIMRMDKINNNRFNFKLHPYCADTVFLNSVIANNKIAYIPEILFNSRIHKNQVTQQMQRGDLDFIYKEWLFDNELYKKIYINNNFEKVFFSKQKKAFNRALFILLMVSPNLKYYFKFLFSKDFNIFYHNFKKILKIINKFLKLLLRKT